MDTLTVTDTSWRGLPAWRIAGARRAAVVSVIGGHLAAFTALDDPLNPLWEPAWPAGDPAGVHPGPDCTWGEGPEASLLAGIAGSNLCLPIFGGPAPGQALPVHGDAGVSRWLRLGGGPERAVFGVRTPVSALSVERSLAFDGDVLELTTSVRHDGSAGLALEWCEHTTLGGAFLDGVDITAGIDGAWTPSSPFEPGSCPRFPARGAAIPTAEALAMPASADPPSGDVVAARVADGWWQAANPRLGWRLSARWQRDDFPWLTLWTQQRSRAMAPWHGRQRTRGMEISTKPFPEPGTVGGADGRFQGRPVTCIVPPGTGLAKTVRFAWERM